jgi:hypothetical protein
MAVFRVVNAIVEVELEGGGIFLVIAVVNVMKQSLSQVGKCWIMTK